MRHLPDQARNPFGLVGRLIAAGHPAAWFAMATTAAGLAAVPLDRALTPFERRRLKSGSKPERPLLFVCGPPRTGTSVVTQTLIQLLDVHYLDNLTAAFPRAPLTAQWLARHTPPKPPRSHESFYGKTVGLSAPNDALFVWDRWLGHDRRTLSSTLAAKETADMQSFFAACERLSARPVINKNNNLNGQAHVVAEALETAHFLCMEREPVYLAQALWSARLMMYGNTRRAYGLHERSTDLEDSEDAVEDVCRQVLFHERLAEEQRTRIGKQRFWRVRYEDFCERPMELVERVRQEVFQGDVALRPGNTPPQPFQPSRKRRIDEAIFERFAPTLERLRAEAANSAIETK